MDRQQTISLIKQKIEDGTITENDLRLIKNDQVQGSPLQDPVIMEEDSSVGEKFVKALYVLGAIIILSGIVILLGQNWDEIGFAGRMISTLGISVATYIVGILLMRGESQILSEIMLLVSAVIAPTGIYILLEETGFVIDVNTFIVFSLSLAVLFGLTQAFARNRILVLVTMFYSTTLYFSLISKIMSDSAMVDTDFILKFAVIVLGVAYFVVAYGYEKGILEARNFLTKEENAVARILYVLGTPMILTPFMTFDGVWDFAVLILIFGMAYLAFFIKSKLVFFISVIFLIIQLVILTAEYFSGLNSWPIMLILIGGMIIGISYASIRVSKNIISN